MQSEVARDLSIPEFLRLSNKKICLECSRLRKYYPPGVVFTPSLETEVSSTSESTHLKIMAAISYTLNGILQITNLETRCSESYPFVAEHVTTNQQVTTKNPFAYRSMLLAHRCCRGQEADCSVNPRVPVLARLHHIRPCKLGVNIQPQRGLDGIDP
jgi:hypothetical protein